MIFFTHFDSYANSINEANLTVSGGYGANSSGTTDGNGYFNISIKPVNSGGPYSLTFSITSPQGNLTTVSGSITVVMSLSSTLSLQSAVTGLTSVEWGVPYSVVSYLQDSFGNGVDSQNIDISAITDSTAILSNNSPSGPPASNVGSIGQTTGTYATGSVSVNARFDQVGIQVLTATESNLKEFLTVQVTPSIVSNIAWTSISPTTLTAGNSVTVSGQALNSMGSGVMDGTTIQLSVGSVITFVQTTHSGSQYGLFTANLTLTHSGTYNLQAMATGNTFVYSNQISVKAGSPTSGSIAYATNSITNGSSNKVFIHVQDQWGNGVPNITVTLNCTATNGGVAPTITQPSATDNGGNVSISEGPFNTSGVYTINGSSPGITFQTSYFTVVEPTGTLVGQIGLFYQYAGIYGGSGDGFYVSSGSNLVHFNFMVSGGYGDYATIPSLYPMANYTIYVKKSYDGGLSYNTSLSRSSSTNSNSLWTNSIPLTWDYQSFDGRAFYQKGEVYFTGYLLPSQPAWLAQPAASSSLHVGNIINLSWSQSNPASSGDAVSYNLDYSADNGASWYSIGTGLTGTGYNWAVPNTISSTVLLRVTANENSIMRFSNSTNSNIFSIVP